MRVNNSLCVRMKHPDEREREREEKNGKKQEGKEEKAGGNVVNSTHASQQAQKPESGQALRVEERRDANLFQR